MKNVLIKNIKDSDFINIKRYCLEHNIEMSFLDNDKNEIQVDISLDCNLETLIKDTMYENTLRRILPIDYFTKSIEEVANLLKDNENYIIAIMDYALRHEQRKSYINLLMFLGIRKMYLFQLERDLMIKHS